jgi:CCT motif
MHQLRQLEQHRLHQEQPEQLEQEQQQQQQQQKHQEQMQDRQQQSSTHGFDPPSSVLAHQQHFLDASSAMHDQHGVGNVAAAVAAAAAAAAALSPYSIPQAIAGGTQLPQFPHQPTHQHLSAHHQQTLPVAPIPSSGTTMLSLSNPGLSAAHQAHITAGVLADPAVSHMLNMGMIMTPSGLVPSNYFFPSSMALSQTGLQSSNSPSPWKPPSVPEVQMASAYRIGRYTPAERRIRLERYREKRAQRNYNRRVKYSCRKDIADKRHRVQGRFVKRETEAVLAAQEKRTSVCSNGQNRMADGGRGTNTAGHALGIVGIGKLSSHGSGTAIVTPGAAGSSSASSDPDFGNIGDDEETL